MSRPSSRTEVRAHSCHSPDDLVRSRAVSPVRHLVGDRSRPPGKLSSPSRKSPSGVTEREAGSLRNARSGTVRVPGDGAPNNARCSRGWIASTNAAISFGSDAVRTSWLLESVTSVPLCGRQRVRTCCSLPAHRHCRAWTAISSLPTVAACSRAATPRSWPPDCSPTGSARSSIPGRRWTSRSRAGHGADPRQRIPTAGRGRRRAAHHPARDPVVRRHPAARHRPRLRNPPAGPGLRDRPDRLGEVFPAEQQPQIRVQLANTLTGIVHQRLPPASVAAWSPRTRYSSPTPPCATSSRTASPPSCATRRSRASPSACRRSSSRSTSSSTPASSAMTTPLAYSSHANEIIKGPARRSASAVTGSWERTPCCSAGSRARGSRCRGARRAQQGPRSVR
jgi:hypothetical protein